jgi:hypothetical protein
MCAIMSWGAHEYVMHPIFVLKNGCDSKWLRRQQREQPTLMAIGGANDAARAARAWRNWRHEQLDGNGVSAMNSAGDWRSTAATGGRENENGSRLGGFKQMWRCFWTSLAAA